MSVPPHKTQLHVSLIQLDSVVLALPQSNLHSVESALDIKPAVDAGSAACIKLHGQEWPVYCPTDNLVAVNVITDDQRICAMLISGDSLFGLVCREVISVEAAQLRPFKLPDCMRTPDTPLHGVGILGERVVCLTSAPALLALFKAGHGGSVPGLTSTQLHPRGEPVTDITEASA